MHPLKTRETNPGLASFPGVGTYVWRVGMDRLYWSPELAGIYGLERPPRNDRDFMRLVHPDDRVRVKAETAALLEGGKQFEHEFRIVRPDGKVRVIHDREVVERDESGSVRLLRGVNIDVTGQRDRDASAFEALRCSERRLELAYEATGTGAWDTDLRTGVSVWSAKVYELLGLSRDQPASPKLFLDHVHPDDVDRLCARFRAAVASRRPFNEEFRIIRTDGMVRHLVSKGRVVEEVGGRPKRIIGLNYDITERKQREEKVRLVMREASHRSKNLLALVQAVARQTMRRDPADFLERFEARIGALAANQDLLLNNEWTGVDLAGLARAQVAHFSELVGTRIVIRGPRIAVSAAAAQALGMAFFELATNAGKYGALSNYEGGVELVWESRDEGGEKRFSIVWTERGGPPASPPRRRGFGSFVLDPMARQSLAAQVMIDYAPEGLIWRLECAEKMLRGGAV
jgi:PAS domain S-box-containing protein